MINTSPDPHYSQLRGVSATVALLAMLVAATGTAGSGTVLAWAVAAIAVSIFMATYYLET